MFSIIEHIEYLLTHHDCVVVPGWGAFIANYDTASYDDGQQLMERPRRTIGFNANVNHNDGLFAQSLMRREGLTFDEAMRFIADSVTTFRQQLAKDNDVTMGHIGFFSRGQGSHPEFQPIANLQGCDSFFGLTDCEIKTISTLEREMVELPAAMEPQQRNPFIRKAARIAASVAVLIGLSIMLTTPIIVNRQQDMASLSPTVTAPQSQQLDMTIQQGVTNQAIETVEHYPAIANTGNTSGKYYMVIATLRDQHELDAFKNKYPELVPHMKMLGYKGMTCVYVARSDDYGTLMGLRDELPQALRDVWIYN